MKYIEESMGWWYSHFALSHCDIFCYIKLWNGQYYCQDSFMEINSLQQKQKSLNAFLWCEFFLIVVLSRLYFTFCALRKLWKRAKISMSFRTSEQDWPPLLFCLFKKPCRPSPLSEFKQDRLAFLGRPPRGCTGASIWNLTFVGTVCGQFIKNTSPDWKHC